MLDLAFLLGLIGWSAVVGRRVVLMLGDEPGHAADSLALAVPLGLGALALAALGLGALGWLRRDGLMVVLAVGALAWAWPVRGAFAIASRRFRDSSRPRDLAGWAIDLALAATLAGTLLTALAPVTDGDALCYHLQVPKVFLASGAAGFEPDLHETVYPLATEMLYAVALAFRGPVACRLVQWALGIVFAANVTALARPVLGPRARWAGTVALLVPAVSNGMGAPLNDVALAAFGMATLHAWVRWFDRPTPRAAALAGMLAGMALGVKYPALIWAGLLGAGMLARAGVGGDGRFQISNLKSQISKNFLSLISFGIAAMLAGAWWYIRAYFATGNPVFPYFRGVFGAGIEEVLDPSWRPLPVTPLRLLTAIGPMTLDPDRFDSVSHQFGPAFLLFLPGIALWRPPRRVWGLAALGYAFLIICLTRRQSMRFVLIAVGPLAVAVAWLLATWRDRRGPAGRLLVGAAVLVLAFEATLATGRARHGLPVVLGRQSRESYLEGREPTFRVGRWVGEHLPASARIVGQDHRGFYIPRPYAMELAHRRRTGLATRGESAGAIVEHFRREGFTHLLLCPPVPESAVEFDPTLSRRLAPWLEGREPVYREALTDADGVVRRYAIYELGEGARTAGLEETRR